MFILFFYGLISKGVFIVGAKRTAFGSFGGTLKNVTGTQLQAHACKATLQAAGVRPDQVDSVIIGNVLVVSILFYFSTRFEVFFKEENNNNNYYLAIAIRRNLYSEAYFVVMRRANRSSSFGCKSSLWFRFSINHQWCTRYSTWSCQNLAYWWCWQHEFVSVHCSQRSIWHSSWRSQCIWRQSMGKTH